MPKAYIAIACLVGLLSGCSEDLPPRSIEYFMRESAALQATLLRCREAGFEAEADVECANARQAAERLGEQEAEAKRVEREAAFERKREALRRRQVDARREAGWLEEEEVEPPLGADSDPRPGGTLSDEAIEEEIRRLQEELEQRSRSEVPAEADASESVVTETAPPPE